jgi:hypothetical protein
MAECGGAVILRHLVLVGVGWAEWLDAAGSHRGAVV